jgi:hypothetical protein
LMMSVMKDVSTIEMRNERYVTSCLAAEDLATML